MRALAELRSAEARSRYTVDLGVIVCCVIISRRLEEQVA
jgi:hypothetical protein